MSDVPLTTEGRGTRDLVRIEPFSSGLTELWDQFVGTAPNGTLLHTRRYLSHEEGRFSDASILAVNPAGSLSAVLPAARSSDGATVVSHPGLTFGGLVYDRSLWGERLLDVLKTVLRHFAEQGFEVLDYRPVPAFVRAPVADDDVSALLGLGASVYGRGVNAVIDVNAAVATSGRRGCIRKAQRLGVQLSDDWDLLSSFWRLLEQELQDRHAANPLHTADEIQLLRELLGDAVGLRVARLDGETVAGTITYRYSQQALHTQYLAAGDVGRQSSALDLVISSLVDDARDGQTRYVSLGTSTDPESGKLNSSLFQYKRSFGAGAVTVPGLRISCDAS
jgi:hypothetical protein